MGIGLEIKAVGRVDRDFTEKIRLWVDEVLQRVELPSRLSMTIWKSMDGLNAFYQKEKEALGVTVGEDVDFLASHEAWRGYPRVHVCEERLVDVSEVVIQGAVHHEIAHALLHGKPEYYTFRFPETLQALGKSMGMDFPILQQCIYFLSIAIKDQGVTSWLVRMGLGESQCSLLESLVGDVEDEQHTWEMVHTTPALRKVFFSALLKTIIPMETLLSAGYEGVLSLEHQWHRAHDWLPEKERTALFLLSRKLPGEKAGSFQERLEQAAFLFLRERSL